MTLELPERSGTRPRTTATNPHTQLDQQPEDETPRRLLEQALAQAPELDGVDWQPSLISVPGARAMLLPGALAGGPPEAFMVATEFAHLHPAPDYSLHLVLPTDLAAVAERLGWAEQHPVARRGLISAGAVMVYAPRDADEVEVVSRLVRASAAYARGDG